MNYIRIGNLYGINILQNCAHFTVFLVRVRLNFVQFVNNKSCNFFFTINNVLKIF